VSRDRALLVLAVLVGGFCAWRADQGLFADLRVYQVGADAVRHGLPLYDARLPVTSLPFTYPPFAALLFLPTVYVAWLLLVFAWSAASVFALGRVLGWALDEAGRPARPWLAVGVTAGALALEPIWHTLSFAQVNLFLLAFIVFDLLHLERRWAGVLLGIAAGIKLTPLLFVVFLVVIGRRRAAALATSTFAATLLVGLVVIPRDTVEFLGHALWETNRIGHGWYAANQSLAGSLARVLGHRVGLGALAVAVLLCVVVLVVARRLWWADERMLAVCVVGLGTLIASPISWSHHWVWVAPLVVALAARSTAGRAWAVGWVAVTAAAPFWLLPYGDDRELTWNALQQVPGNAYLLLALALVGSLAVEVTGRRVGAVEGYDSRAGRIRPATSPSVSDPAE